MRQRQDAGTGKILCCYRPRGVLEPRSPSATVGCLLGNTSCGVLLLLLRLFLLLLRFLLKPLLSLARTDKSFCFNGLPTIFFSLDFCVLWHWYASVLYKRFFISFHDGVRNRRQVSDCDKGGPPHTIQKPSGICPPGTHARKMHTRSEK